jgi:hypothetical protein
MAVYKVIQDVESEDKLIGFLSLKGLIYAGIAAICAFINLKLILSGGAISYIFVFIFAMPMILFGVLASPLGREQPTEVWLLSRIKFFFKPRQRIWDQSGTMDLVTVTAPKKQELHLTKELSQDEVHSRLKTLAMTLDTRGWAIKNVDVNLSVPEVQARNDALQSDRLVGTSGMPLQMPVVDVRAADDIMDEKSNPTAQKFETMMKQAEEERKHAILSTLRSLVEDSEPEKPVKKSRAKKEHHKAKIKHIKRIKENTIHEEEQQTFDENLKRNIEKYARESAAERARRKAEEDARIERELVKARGKFNSEFEAGHHKANPHHQMFGHAQIAAAAPVQQTPVAPVPNSVTAARQADNMELAQSGSAFSVSTLSQLANRPSVEQSGPDEVTISLH